MSAEPLRVLIADDEPLALERLAMALGHVPDVAIVGQASNGREAMSMIESLAPDVAILDINMPGETGLGVAGALPPERRPDIIFLTAYDTHAIDAFALEATDYLLKPLRLDRLRQSLERVRRHRARAEQRPAPASEPEQRGFWIQGRHGLALLQVAEVEWIEAAKDYVMLHGRTRSHILRATMTALDEQFGAAEFLRVHRSAMVRVEAVRQLAATPSGGAAVLLADGVAVAVGPSYVLRVEERLQRSNAKLSTAGERIRRDCSE